MRYEIKSIGIWPFIKVSFFFNLVIGFIFGLLYALFAGFIMTIMSQLSEFQPGVFDFEMMEPMPIGILLVVLPILFAIMGAFFYTIIGVIMVLIYNLVARLVGGYELVLEPAAGVVLPTSGGQPLTGYTGAQPYIPPSHPTLPPEAPPSPPPPPSGGNDQRPERENEG